MRSSRLVPLAAMIGVCIVSGYPADSSPSLVHKKIYAMGSVFEIIAYDASPQHASKTIDRAFDEITRLDRVMSDYQDDSELSRLNKTAKFHPQSVSPDLYRVIENSLQYSRLSGGKFDITVGPLVALWKTALTGGRTPSKDEETAARRCVGYEKILLTPPSAVAFSSDCLRVDLGAIGKGYAVDRAADTLRRSGIEAALIDAGGSTIYALGRPPGRNAWLVHMRDPSRRIDPTVWLRDQSVSTSEQSPRSYLVNSSAGHIIDPATGLPLETHYAVSVITRTATSSDALSTTLLLAGPDAGTRILGTMTEVSAIWIDANGDVRSISKGPKILMPPSPTSFQANRQ